MTTCQVVPLMNPTAAVEGGGGAPVVPLRALEANRFTHDHGIITTPARPPTRPPTV
ncbi:hypothetical protein ACGFZJ_39080 [Streptomyces sp. NPDC048253]|uniref:hypothetical protein n=1 Tax=Streptomyces sp. NPDC048253 TaxID=3365524 RepID=UPI003715F46F